MEQTSGLLSKISDDQYNLLTMEGELLLEGKLDLADGYHAHLDLSTVSITKRRGADLLKSSLFQQTRFVASGSETSECLDLSDDCSNPNDCDCECAEP